MNTSDTKFQNFCYDKSKFVTQLSLSSCKVNQEVLNDLGKYLQKEENLVNELVFDGINLSSLNYLCCLPPYTKVNKLWLRFCQLRDKGVNDLLTVLDETNSKTQLNLLNLDCNRITCEGAKKIAYALRTNRTLQSLSLSKNLIKDEGALALVNVLSRFELNDFEIKCRAMQERRRSNLVEYLMDVIALKLEKNHSTITPNGTINYISTDDEKNYSVESLRRKAESMLISHSHTYSTDKLLKHGSRYYCPGNFKIVSLNISHNRFGTNILDAIEQAIQYQQKICLSEEGIKIFKIEGFEEEHTKKIYNLIKNKQYNEKNNKRFH